MLYLKFDQKVDYKRSLCHIYFFKKMCLNQLNIKVIKIGVCLYEWKAWRKPVYQAPAMAAPLAGNCDQKKIW